MVDGRRNRSLELQARDFEALRGLFESRIMGRRHMLALFFPDQIEYGKKRLRALIAAGYIGERKPGHDPGRYLPGWLYLRRSGFQVLAHDPSFIRHPISWERMQERLEISQSTISHELGVIDSKVAWTEAVRERTDLVLEEFLTWPALYQFKTAHLAGETVVLKPDARNSTRVVGSEESTIIFHEHDRGTEGLQRILAKAYGYAHHYESGDFAVRMGSTVEEKKRFRFRVMIDVKNAERRNNIAEALLKNSRVFAVKTLFGLTTTEELLADPLGEILLTLGDYLAATEHTAYDPLTFTATGRVRERDRMIEAKIKRRGFFKYKDRIEKKRLP
jgi:hypothetical protein